MYPGPKSATIWPFSIFKPQLLRLDFNFLGNNDVFCCSFVCLQTGYDAFSCLTGGWRQTIQRLPWADQNRGVLRAKYHCSSECKYLLLDNVVTCWKHYWSSDVCALMELWRVMHCYLRLSSFQTSDVMPYSPYADCWICNWTAKIRDSSNS